MSMNLSRGLFRAWIAVSLVWCALVLTAVLLVTRGEFRLQPKSVCLEYVEFKNKNGKLLRSKGSEAQPYYCVGQTDEHRTTLAKLLSAERLVWIVVKVSDVPSGLQFPKGTSVEVVERVAVLTRNKTRPDLSRWNLGPVYMVVSLLAGPILVLLILGLLVLWVVGGFRSSDRPS